MKFTWCEAPLTGLKLGDFYILRAPVLVGVCYKVRISYNYVLANASHEDDSWIKGETGRP